MRDLNFELKNICKSTREGSFATQNERLRNLSLIADQLHELGYSLKTAKGLKPKHIDSIVSRWKEEGLTAGTMKNRMAHLRFWADKVGKSGIVKSNDDYGIEKRDMYKGDKSTVLDLEKLEQITCERLKMALRLQSAFGLRREEALKFRPELADKGDYIRLKDSWCKGRRSREIPITTARQRALLDEAHELVGSGSMIPEDMSFIQQLNQYKNQTLKLGMNNLHGLRHKYAQWRYQRLMGMPAPALVGESIKDWPEHMREQDLEVRGQISRELGHDRVDITNIYLGGRS